LELVFWNGHQNPITPENAWFQFKKRVLPAAGLDHLPLTVHSMRHIAGSLMLAKGIDITYVSRILRHKSIKITADIYAYMLPEVTRDAIYALSEGISGVVSEERALERAVTEINRIGFWQPVTAEALKSVLVAL
jgi:integrase